ncbi:MAG: ABC transporter substrate-binding protein [Nitrospinota bacterium]
MRAARGLWIWLAVLSLAGGFAAAASAATKVDFCFAWIMYGKHAGLFAGQEKGFWKKEGLAVTMHRGFGGLDTAKRVATGACTAGSGGVDTLVIARSQGLKVRATGVWHAKSMHIIYARKDRGINTIQNLEGKLIGAAPDEDGMLLFPALAERTGVTASKVRWVEIEPGSKVPSLIAGKVDATVAFVTEGPTILGTAKKNKVPIIGFLYADVGLDVYSNGLLFTEKRIAGEGDLIRRFLRGTLRGLAWGAENPEEATDIFVKHKPEVSRVFAREHWRLAVQHMLTPDTEMNGLGHIGYRKMKFTRDIMAKIRNIKNVEPVEAYYTNEFLPRIFVKRPMKK